ncbi:MAG TPA: 2,3,4,5-tetrahydropyridine-2,6-dicarboxylate N-succinyltransferase, partial [Candidatus Luteimonas excrementigallinarum]|nr:2,3,4,5-tetrahydropyridine-2,6-dicarboxylate N-succinyltransferase [Candidatus Luteimonas excrementigallinarum]
MWPTCCASSACACMTPASPPLASGWKTCSNSPTSRTARWTKPVANCFAWPCWPAWMARAADPAAGKTTPRRFPPRKRLPPLTVLRSPMTHYDFSEETITGIRHTIESAFTRRTALIPEEIEGSVRPAVEHALVGLEAGYLRVAEPGEGSHGWQVNEWLKKAVLLYFRINEMALVEAWPAPFWDKIEARFAGFDEAEFRKLGVRVVPGAVARRGSHLGRDVVLMPSFINIGAHVGEGTMVDTWATVGSCAQVGRHCHISGGAGIGGVLEPLQATPT